MISVLKNNRTLGLLFLAQIVVMVWVFICLCMIKPLFAWLLPLVILQILVYVYLFSRIHRAIFFFLLLLPFCGIGFLPGFYREIFHQGGVLFLVGVFLAGQFLLDKKDRLSIPKIFPTIPALLLLSVSVISLIFNVMRGLSSKDLFRFTFLLWQFLAFLFIIPSVLREKRTLLKAVYVAVGSIIAACLCLIFLILSGYGAGKIFYSLFIPLNLNVVAMMIAPFIPLTIGLSLGLTRESTKRLLYIGILVMIATLLLMRSVGAYLGTLVGVLYVICRSRSYKWLFRLPVLLIPMFLIGAVRDIFMTRLGQTSLLELTLLQRIKLWLTAFPMIKDNFLLGVGLSNFRLLKFQYDFPLWLDPMKKFNTHNLYLEILLGLGLLGLASFVWLFVSLIKGSYKGDNALFRGIGYGLSGGIIAYFIHGLFDCGLWFPPAFLVLALFGGFTSALISCERSQSPS